jgi:alpha-1,6-mannosyltransferase
VDQPNGSAVFWGSRNRPAVDTEHERRHRHLLLLLTFRWGAKWREKITECESKTARLSPDRAVLAAPPGSMKSSGWLVIATMLLVSGSLWIVPHGVFQPPRGAQWQFHAAVLAMAAGWLIALKSRGISPRTFWAIAVALRLILLPMAPGADVHRYIWEGQVQAHGFDPYRDAPNAERVRGLRNQNWPQVEFKDATAIYPPLAELGFRALAMISPSVLFFKLVFVGADLVVCLLLSNRFGLARSLVYVWNPLILYSFAGEAHFDSWFILCLVAGWLLWEKGAQYRAAAMFGAATALKWISLPILAWSIWRIARRDGARKGLVAGCISVLPFVVSWAAVTGGDFAAPLWPKEFVLYARSFELVPAFFSWLWPHLYAQNTVWLFLLGIAGLFLLCSSSIRLFSERWLLALLVFSPMVHAWYFTWLIPFAVATRNAGSIGVSISAFAYFGIFPLPGGPRDGWPLLLLQDGIIWLPLICGFACSEYRRVCKCSAGKCESSIAKTWLTNRAMKSRSCDRDACPT